MKIDKCPVCEKGFLYNVVGNNLIFTIILFVVGCFTFRLFPIRFLYLLYGMFFKKYKCEICGKKFKKRAIKDLEEEQE